MWPQHNVKRVLTAVRSLYISDEIILIIQYFKLSAQAPLLDNSLVKSAPSTILKQPVQNTESNILKQQSLLNVTKLPKKTRKVLCYVVQHPEKENVNALPVMVTKNYKANPRSVLKQSALLAGIN